VENPLIFYIYNEIDIFCYILSSKVGGTQKVLQIANPQICEPPYFFQICIAESANVAIGKKVKNITGKPMHRKQCFFPCKFAICGLGHQGNLRIFNLRIAHYKCMDLR
jgi:hypothetical protein